MKRVYLPIIGFAAFLIGAGIVLWTTQSDEVSEEAGSIALLQHQDIMEAPPKKEKKKIKGWEEFTRMARANQVTGELDPVDMIRAREQVAEMLHRTQSVRAGLNLDWIFMGPSNKGGRSRDILFDKDNPSRVYTGGVSGGLWYSNNEGETWIPYDKDDTLAGIGVVSLAQTTSGDIYVGTGENWRGSGAGSGTSAGGFLGFGIWKSTDGGNTFNHLQATTPSARNSPSAQWAYVPSLDVHPTDGNTVVAGTNLGLRITKDGGQTWTNAATNPVVATQNIQDIEVASNGTIHVSANGRYFRGNIDDPGSFTNLTISSTVFSRLALAVAPSDENYVYAVACNNDGETVGIYQSTDGGTTWNTISPLTMPSESFNPTGEQGNYDMEIAVHPEDKEKVFVAGQFSLYTYGEANGQLGWWAISNWGTRMLNPSFDPQYVHADHHQIVFHPTKPDWMYVATDGGIFRTKNARAAYPALPPFSRQNKNYGVAQFYNISVGIDGKMLGGTQDNGTILLDFQGNDPKHGTFVTGGDAYATDISKFNPDAMFTAIYNGRASRSSNAGETFTSYFDHNIDCQPRNASGQCAGDGEPDCGAPQKTVFTLWENLDDSDPDYGEGRIFLGTLCGLWMATDALDFGSNPVWFNIKPESGVFHTAINLSTDGDVLYYGTHDGNLIRISGLRNATFEYVNGSFHPDTAGLVTEKIGQWTNRYVTSIAVDPNDADHVVVTLGNYGNQQYVYRSTTAATTTGTGSFTSIQGNLPTMPVYSAVIDYYNSSNIIIGTEMGLFSSTTSGNLWQVDLKGMPYVAVLTMVQEMIGEEGCYSLYAGTYGRGIYQSTTLTPASCETVTSTDPMFREWNFGIYPNPAKDFTRLSFTLDQAGDVMLEVYNLSGKRVITRKLGVLHAGGHVVPVNTTDLSTGQYLVVVTNGKDERMVQKLVIAR